MTKLIVLTAGGTGGHVFPALSLAQKLAEQGHQVHLYTDSRGAKYQNSKGIHRLVLLPIHRGKSWWRPIVFLTTFVWTILTCFLKFLKKRPSLVIGFGGYVSAPALIAAYCLRVKTILHEQNAVLGRVNRKLAPYVSCVATSFPDVKYAKDLPTVLTGNPVRHEFLEARSCPYPHISDHISLFVVGGSQGASIFSRVIPAALALLSPQERQRFHLTQQCRPELLDQTQVALKKLDFPATLKAFFPDIHQEIKASHLVIARAGAMTVSELAVAGRPAIFVPYAAAMDNHQFYNAEQVTERGGSILLKESEFTPVALAKILKEISDHPEQLIQRAEKIRHFATPNAVTNLANLVQDLLPR